MEKLVEGLQTYLACEEIKNEYFLSVEYEMIHRNELDVFLPMQLRQEDGKKQLLYDISGKENLTVRAERNLSIHFCERLIRAIKKVLSEVEEYMLETEHIDFSRDAIYVKDDEFFFLYCPDQAFAADQKIEELFAWLLSRIDYEDKKCVDFVYYAYHHVRKEGVSTEKIEEILRKLEKRTEEKPDMVPEAEVPFFPGVEQTMKQYDERPRSILSEELHQTNHKESKVIKGDKNLKLKQTAVWILFAVSVFFLLYFLSIGWKYGFSGTICRYLAGGILLLVFCIAAQQNLGRRERRERVQKAKKKSKKKVSELLEEDPLQFLDEETRILTPKDMPKHWKDEV